MIMVWAIVSCLYAPAHEPNCSVQTSHGYFESLESCEDYRRAFLPDLPKNSFGQEIKASCWHREVSTWQR